MFRDTRKTQNWIAEFTSFRAAPRLFQWICTGVMKLLLFRTSLSFSFSHVRSKNTWYLALLRYIRAGTFEYSSGTVRTGRNNLQRIISRDPRDREFKISGVEQTLLSHETREKRTVCVLRLCWNFVSTTGHFFARELISSTCCGDFN